jgi:hypothetical protein
MSGKFPWVFFGCAVAVVVFVIVINNFIYDIRPGNSQLECTNGCANNVHPEACDRFCTCIYDEGDTLDNCLEEYRKRKEGSTGSQGVDKDGLFVGELANQPTNHQLYLFTYLPASANPNNF